MMTKKDYVFLAKTLQDSRDAGDPSIFYTEDEKVAMHDAIDYAAEQVCDYAEKDNDRFDRKRFLKEAGVEQ